MPRGNSSRQLASKPDNTIIGLVHNRSETEKIVTEEVPRRDNVHIIQGYFTDYASLQAATTETAKITDGSLGYFIANAGVISHFERKNTTALEEDLTHLFKVNLIGNIRLFNAFIPLLQRGTVKKVIAISTGQATLDMLPKLNTEVASMYAISKAGLNTAIAKFSAQYGEKGFLFMSVYPGIVDTGIPLTELMRMLSSFSEYAPHLKVPASVEDTVRDVISVTDR
ncbi:hypothetical protein BDW75DRAFT_234289 [Aspergillus navahoensis]